MADSDVSIILRLIIKPDSTSLGPNELRKNIKTLQALKNYGNRQFYAIHNSTQIFFLFSFIF